MMVRNLEQQRLKEAYQQRIPWLRWGPYLSERQWGTVREDYSDDGQAWSYFTHEQARYRAYRWGEDGLAGISDNKQRLCFALALWNGQDPCLKERLFGLSNPQGNHGEDVKEYYFYLDNTPSHAYMRYLYKYPQAAFPYEQLIAENSRRSRLQPEFELLDTGIFDKGRYFDVFVEYAKAAPDDLLVQITAVNRGDEAAALHLLPTLWFRNTWQRKASSSRKPGLREAEVGKDWWALEAEHEELGSYYLYAEADGLPLFTENETNGRKMGIARKDNPFTKDAFHAFVVEGQRKAVNTGRVGTKAGILYTRTLQPGESWSVRLRLCQVAPKKLAEAYSWWSGKLFGHHFQTILELRAKEADDYYRSLTPAALDPEQARVMRQALSGMLWNKQYYYFDLSVWLEEHGAHPLLSKGPPYDYRNRDWFHMLNDDIVTMPDKWEYPWYAAWDLAFQTIPLAMVDVDFAKHQLDLMLRENYLHPSGQLPAYEWNFSDVNPPVHAWATLFVYHMDRRQGDGPGDVAWLKHAFQKLMLNFTWWVNRKDPSGRNVFEGGFLGLDNIGVFDRSDELPTGGYLEQADGTAWMALYSQNMFEMALELARVEAVYEDMALKFFEHFLYIATAMDRMGDNQEDMWDDTDGFFYDLLRLPDGSYTRLRVRSMVGLLSMCATTVVEPEVLVQFPRLAQRAQARIQRHPDWLSAMHDPRLTGQRGRRLFSVLNEEKLRRVLERLLDTEEFLSPFGIRALSRYHADHPYVFSSEGEEFVVEYLPAESDSGMFGGNSNWRGPIWFPVNTLIIRALLQFYMYYGDDFRIECPTGSGREMNLYEVAREISHRLEKLFLPDEHGRRPAHGGQSLFHEDPHWKDLPLFYEYFHGDNGRGLGASHQTGWTGLVAWLSHMFHTLSAEELMERGFRHRS